MSIDKRPATIYGLIDPLTKEIRYIGQTRLPLQDRLNAHLNPQRGRASSPREHWIESLKRKNEIPQIFAIEIANYLEADKIERLWIAHYKRHGANLTYCDNGPKATSEGKRKSIIMTEAQYDIVLACAQKSGYTVRIGRGSQMAQFVVRACEELAQRSG